jgi:hypothetical protein
MDHSSTYVCPRCDPEHEQVSYGYGHFDATRSTPRRGRKPSIIRLLVGVVGGGLLGIFIGAYALLWIRGADGDLLGIARWLPDAILPPSIENAAARN